MMTLPSQPSHAVLLAFWITLSALSGCMLVLLLAVLYAPVWCTFGVVWTLVLVSPGLLWPERVIARPYHLWRRLAHAVARVASLILRGMCFFVMVTPLALGGSRLLLERQPPGTSLWMPRRPVPLLTSATWDDLTGHEPTTTGWIHTYVCWARQSGNVRACCLLPWLMLLRVFEVRQEDRVSDTMYTLY